MNTSEPSLYLSATSVYEQAADRGLPDPFDTHHSRTSLRSLGVADGQNGLGGDSDDSSLEEVDFDYTQPRNRRESMAMVQKQRAKNNLQAHRRDSYQSSTTSSSQHLSMRSMTSRRGSHLRESFLTATESSLNTLDEEDDSIDGDFYGELRRVDSIYHRSMSERHLQRSMQQLEAENERLRAERDAALLRTSATCADMGINARSSTRVQRRYIGAVRHVPQAGTGRTTHPV